MDRIGNVLQIWGKTSRVGATYHPLLFHLLDVAAVLRNIHDLFTTTHSLDRSSILPILALHDIGKCHPLFQMKNTFQKERLEHIGLHFPKVDFGYRHEAGSVEWLENHVWTGYERRTRTLLRQIIQGHHGNYSESESTIVKNALTELTGSEVWDDARQAITQAVLTATHGSVLNLLSIEDRSRMGIAFSGGLILADWIASNESVYRTDILNAQYADWVNRDKLAFPQLAQVAKVYLLDAGFEAEAAIDRLGLSPPREIEDAALTFHWLFPSLSNPNPVQREVERFIHDEQIPPGLAVLEAPTGSGKTEAALLLAEAWRTRGFYFALPTMATSNQMYDRIRLFLEKRYGRATSTLLVHGMAWLHDGHTPDSTPNIDPESRFDADTWFRSHHRALLAPFGVGTVDQVLRGALRERFGLLRLLGLSNKVLIVDEVHACDAYMSTILARLLQWCGVLEVPVILLSATLSLQQKNRLIRAYQGEEGGETVGRDEDPYPALTVAGRGVAPRTIPLPEPFDEIKATSVVLHPQRMDDAEALSVAALRIHGGEGNLCILVNTVALAQEVYSCLWQLVGGRFPVTLIHSRYLAKDRAKLEEEVVARYGKGGVRPASSIVVATQILEQSLDVDFDVMFSQMAPIDLLIQRDGRMHRHAAVQREIHASPVLHIAVPDTDPPNFGKSGYVYSPSILWRTLEELRSRKEMSLQQDIRQRIERVYGGDDERMDILDEEGRYTSADEKDRRKKSSLEKAAQKYLIPAPEVSSFTLASKMGLMEGQEEWFGGKTRHEEAPTMRVLLLPEKYYEQVIKMTVRPKKEFLRELYGYHCQIPEAWVKKVADVSVNLPQWLGPVVLICQANKSLDISSETGVSLNRI